MDVSRTNPPEQDAAGQGVPQSPSSAILRWPHFTAIMAGAIVAIIVSSSGGVAVLWGKTLGRFSSQRVSQTSGSFSQARFSDRDLDRQGPQKQAEMLLERAVSNAASSEQSAEKSSEQSSGQSSEQGSDQNRSQIESEIESRIDSWRGKLNWDSQLGDLTTVALNSNDQSVRASAIEVQLAAYGLAKNESSVEALVRRANGSDHAQKIWALWTLGLLGNRGIETDRVVQALAAHLNYSGKGAGREADEDSRRWAVEGLALVGTSSTIAPLLDAMHNDPSATVRERAACSLAESGMLSHQQRLTAVPQLIRYSDDPALDAQTRAWAFQALAGITRQRLPNDSAAWRDWYQTAVASGQ
jgi:hypothetical protein